jgi:hypothetical protein
MDTDKTIFNRRDAMNAEILPCLPSLRSSRLGGLIGGPFLVAAPLR